MTELGPLLKAREVAEQLRIDTKTVYAWVNSGRLGCIRTPTGYIRVPQAEVDRALTLLRATPTGPELGEQENP